MHGRIICHLYVEKKRGMYDCPMASLKVPMEVNASFPPEEKERKCCVNLIKLSTAADLLNVGYYFNSVPVVADILHEMAKLIKTNI